MKHSLSMLAKAIKISMAATISVAAMVNTVNAGSFMPRIIGGGDATPNTYPWMVSIQSKSDNEHFCGGSLIAESYILTAAHCIEDAVAENLQVVVSEFDLKQTNQQEQVIAIKNIYMHQNYGDDNDIAVLELVGPTSKKPVKLADNNLMSSLEIGSNMTVMGWGNQLSDGEKFPNILQEVQVPLADHGQCKTNYAKLDMSITDNMICAGLANGGKDSCQGDSGGPLVLQKDSDWFQTGVVSFGEGCAQKDFFGVYTKVASYNEWIAQVMAGEVPVHKPEVDGEDGTDEGDGEDGTDGEDDGEFETEELPFGLPGYVGFLAPGQDFLVEESIHVINEKASLLSVQSVILDNNQQFTIIENACEAAVLKEEEECEIVLGFSASDSEVYEASLSIATSDAEYSHIELALFGIALGELQLDEGFDGIEGVDDEEWYFDGDEAWTGDLDDGDFELSCDAVQENDEAVLMTEIEGPGTLEFNMELSGDVSENTMAFLVDGELVMSLSSDRTVKKHSVVLSKGKHQLSWIYKKTKTNDASAKATISQVSFKLSEQDAASNVSGETKDKSSAGSADAWLLGLLALLGLRIRSRRT